MSEVSTTKRKQRVAMTEETRQTIKANTEKNWEEKLKKANALPDSDEKRALLMLLHSQKRKRENMRKLRQQKGEVDDENVDDNS